MTEAVEAVAATRAGYCGGGGYLYAGLGYYESKVQGKGKAEGGRWVAGEKVGIFGVPNQYFLQDRKGKPFKPKDSDDRRYVDCSEALEESEEEFFHSGWNVRRRRVMQAMTDAEFSPAVVSRFRNCGSRSWVWVHKETGESRVHADFCRSRFCVRCAARVAARARASIAALVEGGEPRLVTLTVAHSRGDSLALLIARLLEAFKKMRREQAWDLRVRGGAWVMEVKYNHKGGGWHPHLHILCDASFLPVKELGELWRKHAGPGDFNVKRVHDRSKVAGYVAKYITKQFDGSVFHHPDRLVEAIQALKGTRTMSTFGSWRGAELQGTEEEYDKTEWKPMARLVDVLAQAKDGSAWALGVLKCISEKPEKTAGPGG